MSDGVDGTTQPDPEENVVVPSKIRFMIGAFGGALFSFLLLNYL